MDALRERSFVFMTLTRLMFLAGPSIFVNLSLYYMEGSMALTGSELQLWLTLGTVTIGMGTVVGTISSAWLAQRLGRKTVAWAAAAVAAAGIVLIVLAAEPTGAVPGLALIGLGSGTYIAVDWALMTSTIPKASSGRYMGLANIANSISGPVGLIVGGLVLDAVTRSAGVDAGPRAATLVGLAFLGAAVLLLIPVKPRVEPPGDEQLVTEQGAAT
jgi:MFS family permease